ncbi:amidase [Bradyrhizobium uaiense]|uniref:Indoleacetamide hydrolase n=1 Tax=Bradyrhizobium uaiense TaxID=2594946 RepID=A0A6P1BJU4_9BRAD|nr:amidase [Bradyrhizobium uaiense]NEU98638.1 amidase [Bradyrhizobium uaiense]
MTSSSIVEMLAGLKAGTVTSAQLVQAALEKARRSATELNAFATIDEDAICSATESDQRYAKGAARELEGIPIAVKDVIDTADIETRYGSAAYIGNLPKADARVVRHLRKAGAVIIGKTTTHEFAWGVTTSSDTFGSTRHPQDPKRIPGGSSGGSAVAVAYGVVPASIGTDTGGSVRIPAALCGVIGLKPTYGALPTEGVFPLAPTLDHVGLICGNAEDLTIFARALGIKPQLHVSGRDAKVKGTIGILSVPSDVPVDRDIARDLSTFTEALRRNHRVVEVNVRVDEAYSIFASLVLAEGGMTHFSRNSSQLISESYGRETAARLERARMLSIDDFARAQEARQRFAKKMALLFEQVDLLILPTCPCPAPLIGANDVQIGAWRGDIRKALMTYTAPFNLVGYPAATLPLPRSADALPAGLQIVGRGGEDHEVVNAVVQFQKLALELKYGH